MTRKRKIQLSIILLLIILWALYFVYARYIIPNIEQITHYTILSLSILWLIFVFYITFRIKKGLKNRKKEKTVSENSEEKLKDEENKLLIKKEEIVENTESNIKEGVKSEEV